MKLFLLFALTLSSGVSLAIGLPTQPLQGCDPQSHIELTPMQKAQLQTIGTQEFMNLEANIAQMCAVGEGKLSINDAFNQALIAADNRRMQASNLISERYDDANPRENRRTVVGGYSIRCVTSITVCGPNLSPGMMARGMEISAGAKCICKTQVGDAYGVISVIDRFTGQRMSGLKFN